MKCMHCNFADTACSLSNFHQIRTFNNLDTNLEKNANTTKSPLVPPIFERKHNKGLQKKLEPVSALSLFRKIFQEILKTRLVQFLTENNITTKYH